MGSSKSKGRKKPKQGTHAGQHLPKVGTKANREYEHHAIERDVPGGKWVAYLAVAVLAAFMIGIYFVFFI